MSFLVCHTITLSKVNQKNKSAIDFIIYLIIKFYNLTKHFASIKNMHLICAGFSMSGIFSMGAKNGK